MMVSVIQAAKQNIQKDSNDSPCYGPLKTADQMLNPANKFFPVGLVILKQFKIGKQQWHPKLSTFTGETILATKGI